METVLEPFCLLDSESTSESAPCWQVSHASCSSELKLLHSSTWVARGSRLPVWLLRLHSMNATAAPIFDKIRATMLCSDCNILFGAFKYL